MTPQDIALLREIVKWRRENGYELVNRHGARYYRTPGGQTLSWEPYDDISFPRHSISIGIGWGDHPTRLSIHRVMWHPVRTLQEAVDLAVAFGRLPARFSSAYRAGWETGREDIEHPVAAGDEFRAIVPAPSGGIAW